MTHLLYTIVTLVLLITTVVNITIHLVSLQKEYVFCC
jgi:hypothetical protein